MVRWIPGVATFVVLAMACGSGTGVAWPSGEQSRWWIVEMKSAALSARRGDGAPWHQKAADSSSVVVGGLVGLAIGNPAAGLAIGEALAEGGGDPLAPAPYIVLKLAGRDYKIAATERTYAPTWQQPIVIDTRGLRPTEPVLIQINDAIDGAVLAQQALTLKELLERPARTLTNIGAVASLDLAVHPAAPRQREEFDLEVPSELTLDALAQGRFEGWRAIPVWNGDTVTIAAMGSVCPSSRSSDCFGPEGAEEGRWRGYSYELFREAPHASLVGIAPDAKLVVGPEARIRVDESGLILLFVNDTDVDNNHGSFHVHVTVDPPR